MQCVTCNNFFLVAPRIENKFLNIFELQDTNSILYEFQTLNDTKITKDIIPFHSTKMSIGQCP
jgi:hypothetical protein